VCKEEKTHGKGFALCFPGQSSANAAPQQFARQRTFAVRFCITRTAKNLCGAPRTAHGKK
jgi:hypothetical protein